VARVNLALPLATVTETVNVVGTLAKDSF